MPLFPTDKVTPLLPVDDPFSNLSGRNKPRNVAIQNPDMGFLESMRAMDREMAHYVGVPLAYMTPGLGDYMAHQDAVEKYGWAKDAFNEGKYLRAAAHGVGGFVDDLTTIPAIGDAVLLAKGLSGLASAPLMALTFAGKGAKTANKEMLTLAKEAEKAGLPAERIRDATGWMKGVDDKWRFEIDDSAAKGNEITSWGASRDLAAGNSTSVPLGEALQHDAYGQAYSGTTGFGHKGSLNEKRIMVGLSPNKPGGSYERKRITAPAVDWYTHGFTRLGHKADKSVLLHEGQHHVQDTEGFASGGSPSTRGNIYPEQSAKAYDEYRRLAGETEARNVQTRMNLTADDRAMLSPRLTEDVPRDEQIIRYGDGPMEMTSWHGSPHKFDKFDISKVGTGEGAQAYGHGMYLAERPGVAKSYQKMMPYDTAQEFQRLEDAYADADSKLLDAYNSGDDAAKNAAQEAFQAAASERTAFKARYDVDGALYEVDLPDSQIEKMLDWDAPLSEQPESVRKAINELPGEYRRFFKESNLPGYAPKMGEAYSSLANHINKDSFVEGQKFLSEELNSLGIPGIKYYDGGSRAAGAGTRNFVVFDPSGLNILSRNGEKLASKAERIAAMTKVRGYHGMPDAAAFDVFDSNMLGKATGAKDSKYGFYHSAAPRTANAYTGADPLEFTGKELKDVLAQTKDQGLDYEGTVRALKEQNKGFDPQNIIDNKTYKYTGGSIREDYINADNYKAVDMRGAAWDEANQSRIAQQAIDEGYEGVVFKNMQDSGWFGGTGADDVYLSFDPKNISRNGEKLASKADLPMDEASRMARAREMGYTDDAYHYSRKNDDIEEFTMSELDLSPFSIGPHVGNKDAAHDRFYMTSGSVAGRTQGVTYPLKIKKGNQLTKDGKPWDEIELSDYLRGLQVEKFGENFNNYKEANEWLADKIWSEYDSIPYTNMVEGKGSTSYMLNPKNIRSRFAKFDPKKADSADILAGAAGLGLTGLLLNDLYRQQEQQY